MHILVYLIIGLASLLLLISALGLIRLPDALSRQHAVTKAASLALSLFILGLMLQAYVMEWGSEWFIKLALLLIILLITLPLASHALARSSLNEKN